MTKKAYMDVLYLVGEEGEPPLTVRPHPDAPDDCVEILATDAEAKKWWGDIELGMSRAVAAQLGRALLAASGEAA
jgi:hypothetical protein